MPELFFRVLHRNNNHMTSGGLVYNIPIPVAAGVKGAPAISLAYNSQEFHFIAGQGIFQNL